MLSSARLYLDQFHQWLDQVGADSSAAKHKAGEVYDAVAGYRFMEALRNHAQHVGRAVHGVSIQSEWVPKHQPNLLEFTVVPFAVRRELAQDRKFKKAVLKECPDRIAILPATRSYIGGISMVHEQVRSLINPLSSAARAEIERAVAKHERNAPRKGLILIATAKAGGTVRDKIELVLNWDDVRQRLQAQNRPIPNLDQLAVSSTSSSVPLN